MPSQARNAPSAPAPSNLNPSSRWYSASIRGTLVHADELLDVRVVGEKVCSRIRRREERRRAAIEEQAMKSGSRVTTTGRP